MSNSLSRGSGGDGSSNGVIAAPNATIPAARMVPRLGIPSVVGAVHDGMERLITREDGPRLMRPEQAAVGHPAGWP
jgi:hypothetical protein